MRLSHRLFLLVLLTLLLPVGLQVMNELELRRSREQALHDTALRQARLSNAELEQVISSARQFLGTLSQLHSVEARDSGLCSPFVERLQTRYPSYALIAVADADGRVFCASRHSYMNLSVSDRPYFQDALRTGRFTIGTYTIGHVAGTAVLPFATPVIGSDGRPYAVVFASVSLDWLRSYLGQREFLEGATLTIADRDGTILVRRPADRPAGQPLPEHLESLLHSDRDGVVERTSPEGQGRIIAYSPIGVPPHGMFVAVSFARSAYFDPLDRATLRDIIAIAVAAALALAAAWAIATRFVARPIQTLVRTARRWHEGDYTARAGLADGRSEIGELGRVFDELADKLHTRERELVAAAEAKRRLLAVAGHDLRQPLQTLMLAIAKLGRKAVDPLERRDFARAERALDRLASALDTLVDASRLDSGALAPKRRDFPVALLLNEIRDEWRATAEEKGIRLRVVPSTAAINSDPAMLGTILHNLLGNAIKYTPQGRVLVGCRRGRGVLRIEVIDTGIGIPADKHETIFREFEQLDGIREGFGLGLAIVRRTADILGHRVIVRSVPGRGSCFAVEVPAAAPLLPSGHGAVLAQ